MKILKKVKSLFSLQGKQPRKSCCDLIIDKIIEKKKYMADRPEDLSQEEWHSILNRISFGLQAIKNDHTLKSPARKKQREQKIQQAFDLLKVYIKHL
jgi:hypothetical protein